MKATKTDGAKTGKRVDDGDLPLIAYRTHVLTLPLAAAPSARDWMDETNSRFANRCLPMLLANQAGWVILSIHRVAATWDGGPAIESLKVETLAGPDPSLAISIFGHGVLTFTVPYLFRTPPGYNLLVRGPANRPKDGISALEGLVETDWSEASFTMNWKLTRIHQTVIFDVGEPIAMVVPQKRGELERFAPVVDGLESDPELKAGYDLWAESRRKFNEDLRKPGSDAQRQGWQKHYVKGESVSEKRTTEHQSKLALRSFAAKPSGS